MDSASRSERYLPLMTWSLNENHPDAKTLRSEGGTADATSGENEPVIEKKRSETLDANIHKS